MALKRISVVFVICILSCADQAKRTCGGKALCVTIDGKLAATSYTYRKNMYVTVACHDNEEASKAILSLLWKNAYCIIVRHEKNHTIPEKVIHLSPDTNKEAVTCVKNVNTRLLYKSSITFLYVPEEPAHKDLPVPFHNDTNTENMMTQTNEGKWIYIGIGIAAAILLIIYFCSCLYIRKPKSSQSSRDIPLIKPNANSEASAHSYVNTQGPAEYKHSSSFHEYENIEHIDRLKYENHVQPLAFAKPSATTSPNQNRAARVPVDSSNITHLDLMYSCRHRS